MKKPNWFLVLFLGGILKIFGLFKGQRIKKKGRIHGPSIVLSNHTSFYDFIYTTNAIYPKPITYVAADKFFYQPATKIFMSLARAIPKKLFEPDLLAIRHIFAILQQKGIIGIFPEGQISAIGDTLKISKAIAKLIKKANVDVWVVKHQNPYFVNPPWTNKTFRGKVHTEMSILFSKQDLANLSVEEIHRQIKDSLSYGSAAHLRQQNETVRKNDYQGLEQLIYQCPSCQTMGLINHKLYLECPHCKETFGGFERGYFGKYPLEEAFYKQRDWIQSKCQEIDFTLQANVKVESYLDQLVSVAGEGTLTLNSKGFRYVGTYFEKQVDFYFDIRLIPTLPSDIGKNIQIYHNNQLFQFLLDEPRYRCQQFVFATEYWHSIKT